jgi:hypothetical protein
MGLSFNKDFLGRGMSALRAYLWRMSTIPYNIVVVSITIMIMIQSRIWNIRKV